MKPTVFSLIKTKKKIMIILGMLHSKMVVVAKAVLAGLEDLADLIFQIYLRTFLGTLVVEEEGVIDVAQITEVQI